MDICQGPTSLKMSVEPSTAKKHIYRKPLPSTCIDFASAEGRGIFKEALNGKHMNSYFNLAAQFRTQDEPAYCGLTTLVMALNALSVDPGRVWKGPWRWFHENMLDCCIPLSVTKKQGIDIFQFCCLAKCNGLDVHMVQATQDVSLEKFRKVVQRITQCENEVLVCSYSRKLLGQSGDGHYSPIGGYHIGRDLVLIFDVARFKYPPHWVKVEVLWKALQGLDPQTGQPRGYFELKRTSNTGISTLFFKLSKNVEMLLCCRERIGILNLTQQWWTWLKKGLEKNYEKNEFFRMFVSTFVDLWCPNAHSECMQLLGIDAKCSCVYSEEHRVLIGDLLQTLEKQQLYQLVEESLESKNCQSRTMSQMYKQCITGVTLPDVNLAHFLTMILFSWPYQTLKHFSEKGDKMPNAVLAYRYVCEEMKEAHQILQLEVELLRSQFAAIFCYCCTVEIFESSQQCCY